jgi:murein DD-endopeptidase MepM/ murein hydrolase activator NlpD
MFTQPGKLKAASLTSSRPASLRVLIAILALAGVSAIAACEQVKVVAKSAQEAVSNVIKPKEQQNENPAPSPAPATPEPETPDGPIVLTPGETPPAEPGSDALADGAPPVDSGASEPTTPGNTEPTTPETPGAGEPATPTTPTTPTTPGTEPGPTTPPATGGGASPTPPTTPGDAVDNAEAGFKNPGAFLYRAAGKLAPGSGEGVKDETIYAPGIAFPVKGAPAFLNSQVYGVGGMHGAAGSECAAANYSYPWQDNFCEKRSGANRKSYNCPSVQIHQGQDIRAGDSASCTAVKKQAAAQRKGPEIVAVEDGVIQYIGAFTVDLRSGARIYRYLHLNMKQLKVKTGDSVKRGQTLGYLSNDFGVDSAGKPVATTLHLHFELKQNIDGIGFMWVSPYMSLVAAYKERRPEGSLAQ